MDIYFSKIYTDNALFIYFFRKRSDIWRSLGAKTLSVTEWWIYRLVIPGKCLISIWMYITM
jgi:hypothetical protein